MSDFRYVKLAQVNSPCLAARKKIQASIRRGVLFCLSLLGISMSWAQFPSGNPSTNRPFSNNAPFSDNSTNNGAGGFPGLGGFGADSLGTDSLGGPPPEVKPDTRFLRPAAVLEHLPLRYSAEPDLATIHYWDQLDGIGGFVQSLGQTGKPYQILLGGVEERFSQRSLWRDPIFDRYDRYVTGGMTDIAYFDTHTPYVEVDFNQGPDQTTITHATLSQNINPFWNITLFIKRQLAEGTYRNFVTDHTTFWGSSNYSSKNRRYWLFTNFSVNSHKDEIHGGVPRDAETEFALIDGVYRDNLAAYNASFFGSLRDPLLEQAQLIRNVNSLTVDQYYHLTGFRDTAQVHRLSLRALAQGQLHNRSFSDIDIAVSSLNAHLIPVYPTLAADSTFITEGFRSWDAQAAGEVSYTWTPDTGIRVHIDGGLRYRLIQLNKDTTLVNQNLTEQYAAAEIRLPWLAIDANIWQRLSARFAPAQRLQAGLRLYPLTRGRGAADTAASPLRIRGAVGFQNLNPSLFQQYFYGDSGNVYVPNPNLQNQRLTHIQAGLELKGQARIKAQDTLLPMSLRISAFYHRIDRQIYYDSAFQVQQAPSGEPMQWIGAALQGRLRMGGHFFLETDTRAQIGTVNSNDPSREWLSRSVPLIHGTTKLYFDHRNVTWAEQARFGVQVSYRTPYLGQAVDPWSGEFFPTNYEVYPFAWGEAFAMLRLRGVYLYARYTYLNEGLFFTGYYTTPFYPMLRRALSFGVNWRFFN